jgi:biopolymer transport protein ExbD
MTPEAPYRTPARPKRKRHKIHKSRGTMIKTGAAKSEINVTPLVDVVLVLLIIFMVVTPMLHRGVHIDLPETAHHDKKQDTGEQLVVSVRGDGTYIETDKLEGERLMDRLRQELKTVSRPVHVRADKSLKYGDVRKVLEQVHAAGAGAVGLGTDEHKE